ncbi:MAG: FMN-binding protein [Clostridiales bacterium]|nr:FMN-binding protein [Clostridiales bacterium]MCD8371469.1 FMN-binding protein [Clostridiales bacterium]
MNKGILRDAGILFVITLVAGFLLGAVHEVTAAPIAAARMAAAIATYQEVFPEAANFAQSDELTAQIAASADEISAQGFGNVSVDDIMIAEDASGNAIGYLVSATSNDGYGGAVQVSVGISADETLTGIGFLTLNETAGLGMNADQPTYKNQWIGKPLGVYSVTKTTPASDLEIAAISGATFTSNASTNAVNAAVYFVQNCMNQ